MSGVTVATISRSIDAGSAPAISSARRAAGQADVGERLVVGRDPALADPGALDDPLVVGVDDLRELVVRRARAPARGTPRPVIEIGRRSSAPIIRSSPTAKVSVPRTASWPSTVALHLAAPDRAANRLDLALERQHVARPHDPLEAHVVDAREERELAAVLLLREHRDGAALRERLDHLHAGHDRVAGKVAGAVLVGDRLARDDALPGTSSTTSSSRSMGSRCGSIASIAALSIDAPPRRTMPCSLEPDASLPRAARLVRPPVLLASSPLTQRLLPDDARRARSRSPRTRRRAAGGSAAPGPTRRSFLGRARPAAAGRSAGPS